VPSTPFVVPPLLLVAVLVVSGVAKLRVPDDTASVFEKLRLPRFLLRFRAPRILPYAELALAAMLLLLPGRWYVVASTLALALFALYLVVVVRALGFGHPVRCGCFGRLGLGWVTRQTVVRNSVLLGVALITWIDSWRGEAVLPRLADAGEDLWWLAAVLLGTDRLLAGGPVTGIAAIEELVGAAAEELRAVREGSASGSPEPEPHDADPSAVSEPIRHQ
jgi:hypothetical protein